MKLPIGYDNFRKLIDHKLDFVDKTLFIKDIIDDKTTEVALITRPRRFGKTLNLSMLQHFLAAKVDGMPTAGLFNYLKITTVDDGAYMQYQGKFPVIFISFKDIKTEDYHLAYDKLCELIVKIFATHAYLRESEKVNSANKDVFKIILNRQATRAQIENSLQILTTCLFEHHGVKPWLLIDEYDTPIQSSFHNGYYNEMISLMRNLFSAALKTNPYLERAVITGILRVAKESMFSGLNNIEVYTLLRQDYSQYFGFTEEEVNSLLNKTNLSNQTDAIKHWYNGYQFGDTIVYNPWSIANCINKNGKLQPYWVNTNDNALINRLFAISDDFTKMKLESLVKNTPMEATIDEHVAFMDFSKNPGALWSLLLSSGYLKAISCEPAEDKLKCKLVPPNYEVSVVYRSMVKNWFADHIGTDQYDSFITSLLKGNIDDFSQRLKKYLSETFSIFDVTGRYPEKFYHGFVLGLISSTLQTHIIKSNHESGYGRYDVMVIPKDLTKPDALGLILEFKVAAEGEELESSAKEALHQIDLRAYEAELKQADITNIIKVGLAFAGKKVAVLWT